MVEVPSDIIASPDVERAITLAGLSPVNGATIHSVDSGLGGQAGSEPEVKMTVPDGKPHL